MKRMLMAALLGVAVVASASAAEAPTVSRDAVVTFVEEAVGFAQKNGKEAALAEFMKRDGLFVRGQLYIYAYDFKGNVISHGGQPELVGRNLINMKDPNGVMVIKELIKLAKDKGGWLEYSWPNPLHDNKVEPKAGYVLKVDDTWFLGSGIYPAAQK